MDKIYAKIAKDTTKFNLGDEEEWRELFEPIAPQLDDTVSVVRDQAYGPDARHRLDIYLPKGDTRAGKPVLLFMHGGGFFSGDKAWTEKYWGNIGIYFAKQGVVTVVVNHRLVYYDGYKTRAGDMPGSPDTRYPDGADDVQMAREWIYHNISGKKYGCGSPSKVVLFGHSSGGAHIAANLYAAGDPERKARTDVFPPVAGIIYLSVPFRYDANRPIRKKILQQYYGSDSEDAWGPKSALGLFESLPEDAEILDANKYPTYIGTVKWEVQEAFDGALAFFKAYQRRSSPAGTLPWFHVLDKHNHLSNVLSIGTEDSSQATKLLEFVTSCTQNSASSLRPKSRL